MLNSTIYCEMTGRSLLIKMILSNHYFQIKMIPDN
jgi:hypothetical protein